MMNKYIAVSLLMILFAQCSKDSSTSSNNSYDPLSSLKFIADINNVHIADSGLAAGHGSGGNYGDSVYQFYYSTTLMKKDISKKIYATFDTKFMKNIARKDMSEKVFTDFFSTGEHNFRDSSQNGYIIHYKSSNGVDYKSYWPYYPIPQTQKGSSFNIISTKLSNGIMKVYAKFNCNLYDDKGNSMILKNGEMVSEFYYSDFD